ncbi:MAG: DUF4922 domain-containing protein [Ignavibacteriaceae bacterium]
MNSNILYSNKEIENFISLGDFGNAAKALLEQQEKSWQQLAEGYKSLEKVQTKEFQFDGFTLRVQFNPGRIVSTSAKVDEATIKERKCFLCEQNLPPEQKGILYRSRRDGFPDNFLILCNPFPIFPEHFTIPGLNHTPQTIKDSFEILLSLSKDLSSHYTVFYNGPKCGASAPDHLHFQAGNKFFMPVDKDYNYLKEKFGEKIFTKENINIYGVDDGLRRFISFESKDENAIKKFFNIFYSLYESVSGSSEEPKMNVLSFYDNEIGWRVIFFLREKHRPSHFFADEANKILLSPAGVDIGGVCITPLEKDFNRITKNILIEIFNEVSFDKDNFEYFNKVLKEKLKS